MPRSTDVIVRGEQVETCKPGDKVPSLLRHILILQSQLSFVHSGDGSCHGMSHVFDYCSRKLSVQQLRQSSSALKDVEPLAKNGLVVCLRIGLSFDLYLNAFPRS